MPGIIVMGEYRHTSTGAREFEREMAMLRRLAICINAITQLDFVDDSGLA